MRRVAAARGIESDRLQRFMTPMMEDLPTPRAVPGAGDVGRRLVSALREKRPLAIFGDYDADGMCAAAILVHALQAVAPEARVTVHIPKRGQDAYGLSIASIEGLAANGFKTIVTVDCGITALKEAKRAKELGVELLITDHHARDASGQLPEAAAIAHPGLGEAPSEMCGAAVAWVVALALFEEWAAPAKIPPRHVEVLAATLALAAVGTVADVIPLVGYSRAIVALGLESVANSSLPGLKALVRQARIRPGETVDAEQVSFGIGPLLNACGRLGSAVEGVELLALPATTNAVVKAGQVATRFAELNERRKERERRIVEEASKRIEEGLGRNKGACVLADPAWSRGIVGIACARIAETHHVPVVLLEVDGEFAHGSGRSVEGYSLLEGLVGCAEWLDRFGGHAAAAGVSMRVEHIPAFREALSDHAARRDTSAVGVLKPDVEVAAEDLSLAAITSVLGLGPFGNGFPMPTVLVRGVRVASDPKCFGASGDHLSFYVSPAAGAAELRCTWWRQGGHRDRIRRGQRLHLVARPQIDRYQGTARAALVLFDVADADVG